VQYSEQFDNAYWVKTNTTVVANSAISPNGTTTAELVYPTTTGSNRLLEKSFTISTNTEYTGTWYLKASGLSWVAVDHIDGNVGAWFNLSTGTIGTISSGSTASIESVGNGWYRCRVSKTSTGSTTGYHDIRLVDGDNVISVTANGTNGVLVWGAQLNIGATAKPYFPTTDRLNVPRLTYQNGGGGCPSLLLEKQSTNLATYSEQINSTNYTLNNVTSSENSLTSPDGTINADKIIENTSNSSHSVDRVVALGGTVDNSAYSVSVFAKAEGRSQVLFYDNNQNVGGITYFNLSTGVVTSGTGKIENFGNGWYRCTIFCLKDNSTSANLQLYLLDSAGNSTYTGNGTSGIGLWGYQLEASSYPTSYIPTTSASATRVADACYKTGISSLISSSEYTLFWQGSHIATGEYNSFMTASQTINSSNSARFYRNNTNNEIRAAIFNASNGLTLDLGSNVTTTRVKCALRVKNGDFALFINGVKTNSNTTALAPSSVLDEINLQYFNNSQSFGQNCEMACFFKTALTDTEAIALTTL
jgi:hypothetical protein